MTITKQHNGILISDIINGQYVKRLYQGYTVKEAKKLFGQYIESLVINHAYIN